MDALGRDPLVGDHAVPFLAGPSVHGLQALLQVLFLPGLLGVLLLLGLLRVLPRRQVLGARDQA